MDLFKLFCKKVFLKFQKLKGKHLIQGLFLNKVPGLRPTILLKKRLCQRCFPVNFANFLEQLFIKTPPAASDG